MMSPPPMPPKEPPATTVDERTSFNVKFVIAIIAFVTTSLGTFFSLRGDVQLMGRDVRGVQEGLTEMKSNMTGLRTDIDALKKLSNLEIQLDSLRRNGSDNLHEVRDKLDKLKESFDMHVATTTGKLP